jgi:hypothetical protein
MSRPLPFRLLAPASILLLSQNGAFAQVNCAFSEPFDGPYLPIGWSMQPELVYGVDSVLVAPWDLSTAQEANASGYIMIPDEPLANSFAVVNDDAPPCDCELDQVALISPVIDLSASLSPALSFRVYHDGRPFNTNAWVDASTDGTAWTTLLQVPEVVGDWQSLLVDLSAYGGGPLQLRFRFDDGGQWASGMAVDDVCVFGRTALDLSVLKAYIGDPTESPFNTTTRSLGYTQLPYEQQLPLVTSIRLRNLASASASDISISLQILVNNVEQFNQTQNLSASLTPLADTTLVWNTGWTSTTTGDVQLNWSISSTAGEDSPADNVAQIGYTITDAVLGNNGMALDNDLPEAFVQNDGAGFSTGCRYELTGATSVIRGIGVRYGGGTTVGTTVAAFIMDEALNVLSVSATDTISQADLDLSFAGGTVYIALDSAVGVTGPQDVVALVRYDEGSGSAVIAAGGPAPIGAAWKVGADGVSLAFLERAPIVRIYLSEPVTAIGERTRLVDDLVAYPNPAFGNTSIGGLGKGRLEIADATGRVQVRLFTRDGSDHIRLDIRQLAAGEYSLRWTGETMVRSGRLVVWSRP